jgi:tetratricopeptide (TPR) repeat protein
MGLVAMQQGKLPLARKDYLTALRLDPGFVPAYANLADLYRALGADAEGEQTLKDGLQVAPDSADLHHALGLLYIRVKRLDAAVDELARAAQLAPENSRYAYVHALALKETGDTDAALAALTDAYRRNPADRDTLLALVTMNRDAGNLEDARSYAQALRLRYPDDPDIAALARALLQ